MSWMMGLGGTLVGIFIFLHLITLIILAVRLVKMTLWAPVTIPIQRAAAADALPVLDAAQLILEQEGFVYTHTRRVRSIIAADLVPPGFCDVYYHAARDIHAEVYVSASPAPGRIYDIYLWNSFVDGTALLTTNGLAHALIPYPRRITTADAKQLDFTGHIATHLDARAPFTAERTAASDALNIARELAEQLFPQLEKERQVYRRGNCAGVPVYGFRMWAALRSAWRMRLYAAKLKKKNTAAKSDQASSPATPAPATVAAERIAFVRTLCTLNANRAPRWFRWWTLILSAIAFLTLGTWWWGIAGAVTVVAVVAVHEAGHWLAMKLARFRDVQVFFVPGMGGATSGEKHDASPLTHLVVYLAGPVPGLLLSLAVFAWVALGPAQTNTTWYPLVLTGAVAAFLINALNLLPVLPLDGGRVIELFILGRLPWLRFIFAVSSGGLLLAGGIASADNVVRAIGIIVLIGARHHYRIAKVSAGLLRAKLAKPQPVDGFPGAAMQLYDFLAQPGYRHWTSQTKILVGMALLPRFLGRLPSWKETVFGLTVYAACAVVPLVALGTLVAIEPSAVLGAIGKGFAGTARDSDSATASADVREPAPAARLDAAALVRENRARRAAPIAAAHDQGQRFTAVREAIENAYGEQDDEDALRLAKLFYAEASAITELTRERAEAAMMLANALHEESGSKTDSVSERKRLRQEAETILRQLLAAKADPEAAAMLAQILEIRLGKLDDPTTLATHREIVTLLAANLQKSDGRLTNARENLARSLDHAGQAEAAERELRGALNDVENQIDANTKFIGSRLRLNYAWMMLAHNHTDEATRLVEPYLLTEGKEPVMGQVNERDAHLILAMIARRSGDWTVVKRHVAAARESKPIDTGSWIWNLIYRLTSKDAPQDRRAGLLLIEAERALGHPDDADKLLTALRKSYRLPGAASTGRIDCRMYVNDTAWHREFQQTLADIEQREMKCTSRNAPAPTTES